MLQLPAAAVVRLLGLPSRGDRVRGAAIAGVGVDNGDGVAGPLGQRLVELEVAGRAGLEGGRRRGHGIGVRSGGEGEAWRRLQLRLEGRRVGRAAR